MSDEPGKRGGHVDYSAFWGKGIYSSSLELELLLLLQPFQPCLCLCLNIFLALSGLTFLSKAAPARAPAPTANPLPRLPLIGIGRLDLCLGYPPWDIPCLRREPPAKAAAPAANPAPKPVPIPSPECCLCGSPGCGTKCVPTACPGYAAPGGGY